MLIKKVNKNTFDIFFNDGWDNWGRFSTEQNELTKIVAPSGTGKTTLTHFLYHLRNDYEGTIFYDDIDTQTINSANIATYRQHKLSIIFQDLRLFPQLTAKENIELKRKLEELRKIMKREK